MLSSNSQHQGRQESDEYSDDEEHRLSSGSSYHPATPLPTHKESPPHTYQMRVYYAL
jgi:hypothetical protein